VEEVVRHWLLHPPFRRHICRITAYPIECRRPRVTRHRQYGASGVEFDIQQRHSHYELYSRVTSTTSNFNLRGLGPRATLTLVDGKRVATDNVQVMIPASALQRVEVVTDGAAALYGTRCRGRGCESNPLQVF